MTPGAGAVLLTQEGGEGLMTVRVGAGPLTRGVDPLTRGAGPLTRGAGPLTRGADLLTRGERTRAENSVSVEKKCLGFSE